MPISGNQWRVTNVCPGLIYEFKVAAENAAGVGKMSKTSEEVLAIDACGMYLHIFSPTSCLTIDMNTLATYDVLLNLMFQSHQQTFASLKSQRTR